MKYIQITGKEGEDVKQVVAFCVKSFFEGVRYACEAIVEIPLDTLGIRDIEVYWSGNKKNTHYLIQITLVHPGILIGKKGITIKLFQEYLEKRLGFPTKIKVRECESYIYGVIHNKDIPKNKIEIKS